MGVDVDDSHLYIIPWCCWVFVFSNFERVIEASFPVSFTFCILSFIVITLYRPIVFIIYYRIERNTHRGVGSAHLYLFVYAYGSTSLQPYCV